MPATIGGLRFSRAASRNDRSCVLSPTSATATTAAEKKKASRKLSGPSSGRSPDMHVRSFLLDAGSDGGRVQLVQARSVFAPRRTDTHADSLSHGCQTRLRAEIFRRHRIFLQVASKPTSRSCTPTL